MSMHLERLKSIYVQMSRYLAIRLLGKIINLKESKSKICTP